MCTNSVVMGLFNLRISRIISSTYYGILLNATGKPIEHDVDKMGHRFSWLGPSTPLVGLYWCALRCARTVFLPIFKGFYAFVRYMVKNSTLDVYCMVVFWISTLSRNHRV